MKKLKLKEAFILSSALLVASCASPIPTTTHPVDCRLTVQVYDAHDGTRTIGNAAWCTSEDTRTNWIEFTNYTGRNLTAVRICATALEQSGAPTGKSYCGRTPVLSPGQTLVTPHFSYGAYGIQAAASESSTEPARK